MRTNIFEVNGFCLNKEHNSVRYRMKTYLVHRVLHVSIDSTRPGKKIVATH